MHSLINRNTLRIYQREGSEWENDKGHKSEDKRVTVCGSGDFSSKGRPNHTKSFHYRTVTQL